MSFRARPIGRRGISMSSRIRHRRCEGSLAFTRLGGDASLCSAWTSSWQEIFQGKAFLNDIVPYKGIYPISKRFFLPAVVGMTIMSFRAYARNLHIINGRGFLAFPYRRSWNFRNILYDAERWLLRHGIKQKAIHIE